MLTIIMDNGNTHSFTDLQHDDYEITKKFAVIRKGDKWVGCFSLEHFVSLTWEPDMEIRRKPDMEIRKQLN